MSESVATAAAIATGVAMGLCFDACSHQFDQAMVQPPQPVRL